MCLTFQDDGDDAAELPSDVSSSDGDDNSDLSKSCKCSRQCTAKFATGILAAKMEDLRKNNETLSRDGRNKFLFSLILEQLNLRGHTSWTLLGQRVCREAWRILARVSRRKLDKYIQAVRAGHQEPLPDRRLQGERLPSSQPAMGAADKFLNWLYQHVGEPLATSACLPSSGDRSSSSKHKPVKDKLDSWLKGKMCVGPTREGSLLLVVLLTCMHSFEVIHVCF